MSGLLMGRAFYFELQPRQKLLLLAIADHANDDGYGSHPSQVRLAEKVGCTSRHIRNLLGELESMGLVTVLDAGGGVGLTSRYHLPWAEEVGRRGVGKRGNISDNMEVQSSAEPSLEPPPPVTDSSKEESSSGAREDDDLRISSYQDLYSNLPDFDNPITDPAGFFDAVRKNGSTIPHFNPILARQAAELIQHALYPRRLQFPHPKKAAGLDDVQDIIRTHPKLINKSGSLRYGHLRACVGEFLSTDGDEEGGELNPDTVLTRLARQPDKLRQVIDLSSP